MPEASEYMVQRREKTQNEEKQVSGSKRERTIPLLVDRGILKQNDHLHLIELPKKNLNIPSGKEIQARSAIFLSAREIRWEYDGKNYSSLSRLCERICEEFGVPDSGPFQGPAFWAKTGENKSLAELADIALSSDSSLLETNDNHTM